MASLGFDLLDRHVVDGRGEELACSDDTAPALSFAQLLERAAALAGGLAALGVTAGTDVGVRIDGIHRVVAVCACVRLGAVPGPDGVVRLEAGAEGVVVRAPDHEVELGVLMRAGATDPASSLATDALGFRDAVRAEFAAIIDPLLAGATVD